MVLSIWDVRFVWGWGFWVCGDCFCWVMWFFCVGGTGGVGCCDGKRVF